MAKPSETWRNKSSERKAEAKLTSSSPARLPCTPAKQSSKACWWLLITFCCSRHPHPTPSPYHKGPPQQGNNLFQQLPLHQCPSSPLGPKFGILPQALWTVHHWAGPHPRQPWKAPQLQMVRGPTLEQGAQADPLRSIQPDADLVKEARKEYSQSIPTTSLWRAPVIS